MILGGSIKAIKAFLILSVFWMLLFGLFAVGGDVADPTQKCPFSNHSMVICQMNPAEHIQEWQSMFTMLPVQSAILALLAIFAFFAIFKFKTWGRISLPNPALLHSQKYKLRVNNFQIFDPLQEAFSNGILNPKLF